MTGGGLNYNITKKITRNFAYHIRYYVVAYIFQKNNLRAVDTLY